MDLEYLKANYKRFAYELRKFFPTGENPVGTYLCEEHVVVISTQKVYIFYYKGIIDYAQAKMQDVLISNIKDNKCTIKLENKDFDVEFYSDMELKVFVKYYDKYK